MRDRLTELQTRYRRALSAYVDDDDNGSEKGLIGALDLGKAALAEGQSLLDLISTHHHVVPGFITNATTDADVTRRFTRAEEFLAQVVAPFDMANRGWVEVVGRLRLMNATLERTVGERTAALRHSEQRFRDITEVAGDWIWETGRDHRFTFFVGQSLGAAAITLEAVLGKTWWEFAGRGANEGDAWARYRRTMDKHEPFRRFHHVVTIASGARLYVAASGKPVFDESGDFLGYRGTATDETIVINAHHRTEQAETLLRDAIESIYEGFAIFDGAARLLSCNRAFREMHASCAALLTQGTTFETLLRGSLANGLYPEALGHENEWLAERLGQHRRPSGAVEHRFHDGRWLLVTERRMSNGGTAGLYIDITDLKTTQAALRESEARLDRAQRIAGIGSWEVDLQTRDFVWSKEMYRLNGRPPGTPKPALASLVDAVHEADLARLGDWLTQLRNGRDGGPIEFRVRRSDGEVRVANAEAQPVTDAAGKVVGIAGTLRDVTERRLIDQQLAQAQKMEAIGNLTGGMAHDFNNLLGVVIGNLDLLRERHGSDPALDELAREALDAATRGADLTRGLLAFARRQPLQPRRIDVNEVVSGITKLLRRTLGERVEVILALGPGIWPVMVDSAQLEATLANLATNARDAMPKGGRLTIATKNQQLDADYAALHPDVAPGDYAAVEVSDTGTGIAPDILGRVFEPFFTTKDRGQGSGLGLAMVFGYVKQSGGHINVYSEVGVGTTFRLYLPRARGAAEQRAAAPAERPRPGRGETVLVVEDNAALRRIAARQLIQLGYIVVEAENARAAVALLETTPRIHVLFTDVVMPGEMDGIELARLALSRWPALRIILTSGFPGTSLNGDSDVARNSRLLSKPYRKEELARVLRDVIDGVPG
jgi:PAS domain S-box-containing protein